MFDVFRSACFALRTFLGFVLLVLTVYAAMWVFIKIDSMATRNPDPDATLRLVKSYNPKRTGQHRAQAVFAQWRMQRGSCCAVWPPLT